MIDTLPSALSAEEAIDVLRELMHGSESEPTRLGAAKTVLERIAPKEDSEAKRRETEDRDAAIAEARALLAEFAASKLASLCEPRALDQSSAAATTDTNASD